MNGDLDLVDIAKDSPTNIGAEQKSSPVDNEANKALREMIQKQAQELEQEKKARAELEARLDEARYLLKIIASGPRLADPEQNNTSVSAINDTITELELALNKIEIKEEPAQPALKIPHPISISNPHYADEDSNDSAYDSNGKHGVKSYSKSPRRRANGHSPKKSQKTPIRHSDFVTSPNSAKIAPIEKYHLQESPENYNSQSKSNNTDGEDAAASDNYASDNNGSTFITQYVSLKAKKDNKTPIAENATMSEGEEQLQGYSDLLPSPSHEQSKAASQANKYSPDQEDSFEKIDSEESPKSSKVTFLTDMTVSDDSPLTVPKSSSFLRKVAVLNSHRMANPESQSNDDDIQYEEQDSQEFNSDMEPLKPNKNNRRDSDDFLNGVDEENGKIRKKQRKNLLLDPQEDDDDRSDDSSHYPYAFEKTPKIRVPHRSGSGNLMNFLNSPPSLVPEIVENTNKNKQLGKNALLQEDDSPIANFMEGEESNDDTHDDIFSKDPSVISQEDAVQQILDDLEKENNAALAKAEIVREQDVINDEDLPPPPPKMALPTIDEQPGAEDVSPPPPPPPSILTDLVHDTEEALNESFTDEYVNIEPENNAEGEDGELPPPPPIQSEPSPIESPEDIQSPEISDIHAEADIDNVPPPKFSEEPNTPMPNTASLSTNPQTPSNVIRPINEVVQYIDTSLREDIISPLSVSISSDVEESNATSPVMGDHKSNLALLKERIGTRTPLNQSTDRSYNFTTPPPQDITQIAPDSAHARDLDMQFDTTLDNDLSDSMIKDDNNVNNAVYNTTYTAPLDDRGANYHEDIDINIPLDLPALDPFLSLISYYRPFLIAAKYCDSRSALRGTKAYFSVVNTSVSLGSAIGISADEMLLWVIFQLYGNPTEGGIISRLIK